MYLQEEKFSLWVDFIERDFIEFEFKELIGRGVINGATSNPAIFKNAILTSPAYQQQLSELKDLDPKTKYEAVAIRDIQMAADVLRPSYDRGDDGYISMEVDPNLCDDTSATVEEGKRLHRAIGRPNVMIKVPATEAGYKAMEQLVAEGIPVNATLVFSKEQALASANSFALGMERGEKSVDTVISIFVSRYDRAIDVQLGELGIPTALSGIYNAADIYAAVKEAGVARCRTLFASTGVKSDALPASYYVAQLLAADTVDTAPIKTIEAFVSSGDKTLKLPLPPAQIKEHFTRLEEAGIDVSRVQAQLMHEGLEAFKIAFGDILAALE